MLVVSSKQIAEAAAAKKLPTVYGYREHVEAGGLISYGVNLNSCFHRAAYYVDKILKGALGGLEIDDKLDFGRKLHRQVAMRSAMSAFGTKRTSRHAQPMSALRGKADIE